MKKFWIQVTCLLLIGLGALYVSYNRDFLSNLPIPTNAPAKTQQLKINDVTLKVEVADTPSKRQQGLSGRDKLATGSGMLFVFPQAKKYQFWMKGMKFPLDFIYIKDGAVVDLIQNVPFPSPGYPDSSLPVYEPTVPVNGILEVNAGFVKINNIKIGDKVFTIE